MMVRRVFSRKRTVLRDQWVKTSGEGHNFQWSFLQKLVIYLIFGYFLLANAMLMSQATNEWIAKHVAIKARLDASYQERRYTFEAPFIKVNPFANNPLVAEIRFRSPTRLKISILMQEVDGGYTAVHYKKFMREHRYPILGLYPNKANAITILAKDVAGKQYRQEVTIQTEALPSDYPLLGSERMVAQHNTTALQKGYYYLMLAKRKLPMGATFLYSAIDTNGTVRWINTDLKGHILKRTARQTLLVTLANDANIYHSATIYEMDHYGQYIKSWHVPSLVHHELQILPNKNLLLLSNSDKFIEDTIIEIAYSSAKVVREFNIAAYVPPDRQPLPGYTHVRHKDWAHLNSLDYDPVSDTIFVSSRNQSVIIAIARRTGKLKWLSGPHDNWQEPQRPYLLNLLAANELEAGAGTTSWHWGQHCVRSLGDGKLLVFDNGRSRSFDFAKKLYAFQTFSRAVEYHIDAQTKTIKQVWEFGRSYGHELYSSYVSGVQYLPAANTVLINFGGITKDYLGNPVDDSASHNSVRLFEVTKDANKDILFEFRIQASDYTQRYGFRVYRAQKYSSLYY